MYPFFLDCHFQTSSFPLWGWEGGMLMIVLRDYHSLSVILFSTLTLLYVKKKAKILNCQNSAVCFRIKILGRKLCNVWGLGRKVRWKDEIRGDTVGLTAVARAWRRMSQSQGRSGSWEQGEPQDPGGRPDSVLSCVHLGSSWFNMSKYHILISLKWELDLPQRWACKYNYIWNLKMELEEQQQIARNWGRCGL